MRGAVREPRELVLCQKSIYRGSRDRSYAAEVEVEEPAEAFTTADGPVVVDGRGRLVQQAIVETFVVSLEVIVPQPTATPDDPRSGIHTRKGT
jgi:hypothetical protein